MAGQDLVHLCIELLFLDIAGAIAPVALLCPARGPRGIPELFRIVDVPDDGDAQFLDASPIVRIVGIRHGNVHALPGSGFAFDHFDPVTPDARKFLHLLGERGRRDPIAGEFLGVIQAGHNVEQTRMLCFHIQRLGKTRPCRGILDRDQCHLVDARLFTDCQHCPLFGRPPHVYVTIYDTVCSRLPFAHFLTLH